MHQRVRLRRRRLGWLGQLLLIPPPAHAGPPRLPSFSGAASIGPVPARPWRAEAAVDPSIRIVAYDPRWPALYQSERARLIWLLGTRVMAVEHIGSTAVPGMGAKPCVDIQVGVRDVADVVSAAGEARWLGYGPAELGASDWRLLRKFSPACFHLHLTTYGSPRWQRNMLVRDHLRRRPEAAAAYLRLKLGLAARHTDIRDYSEGKSGFVLRLEAEARRHAAG